MADQNDPHSTSDQAQITAPLQKMLDDLQVRMAFLDDTVEQLNRQIAAQNQELLSLRQQLQLLYRRVEAADLSEGIAAFDPLLNKPPHY